MAGSLRGEGVTAMVLYKPPFPWFGGKSRVASIVWERFGDVRNYVEPFFGSGAVLLNRPHQPQIETVNDLDCYLANFWRALQAAPEDVAHWANWPVNEADLHARHDWLIAQDDFRHRMHHDADYYDAQVAGWWVWGISQWIGSGWCDSRYWTGGTNLPQQRPHLSDPGGGIHRPATDIFGYMAALAERMRNVRVCCGDWDRVLGPSPTVALGQTAVFLDPPYTDTDRAHLYAVENFSVGHDVQAWAIEHGDDPMLRIALCGYDPLAMPGGWERVQWKAVGGYGSRGNGRGKANAYREVIWFSPHCLQRAQQMELDWEV